MYNPCAGWMEVPIPHFLISSQTGSLNNAAEIAMDTVWMKHFHLVVFQLCIQK